MKLPGKADAVCVKEDCGTCQKGDSCSRESLAEWQLICPVPLGRERWPASGYSELLALFGSSCSENLDTCDRRGQCTFLSVEAVTRSLDQWDPQTQAVLGPLQGLSVIQLGALLIVSSGVLCVCVQEIACH